MFRMIKDENGNSVIEATVITTIVMIMILILMIMGFLFYQESLLQTVANETATSIARTHSYDKKDPVTGFIDINELKDQGLVGSVYWIKTGLSGNQKSSNEEIEAKNVAKKLMNKRRLMSCVNNNCDVKVTIQNSSAALFQDEVVVEITESYSIPFVRLLGVSSEKSVIKHTCTGRAVCYDIIGANSYYNGINAVAKNIGDQAAIKMFKNIVKLFKTSTDIGKNFAKLFFE